MLSQLFLYFGVAYFATGLGVWLAFRHFAFPQLEPRQQREIGVAHVLITVVLWWMVLTEKPWEDGPHD